MHKSSSSTPKNSTSKNADSNTQRQTFFHTPVKGAEELANLSKELLSDISQSNLDDLLNTHDRPNRTNRILTEADWNELVERLCTPSEKKKKVIQKILEDREKQFEQTCTFLPEISDVSRKMNLGRSRLEDSVETLLKEREKRILEKKQQLEKRDVLSLTFNPQINESSKKLRRSIDSFATWGTEKTKKWESLKQQRDDKEVEGCVFKPDISSGSKKIMEKKKLSKSVFDRNYEFEFLRMQKLLNTIEEEEKSLTERKPTITLLASEQERTEPIGEYFLFFKYFFVFF